jgi:uncharacterized protein (DUF1697 family)
VARHIALLRGINLGARNRVSMPDLRELLGKLGYEGVRTLLQSGNVVVTSSKKPGGVARELEAAVAKEFGVESKVIVRTRAELAYVVKRNPFEKVAKDPKLFQVSFLSAEPKAAVIKELLAADVAPEQVACSGREVYAWHPDGIQRSPLAKLLTDKRLGVTATARNWNTVTKLLELAGE